MAILHALGTDVVNLYILFFFMRSPLTPKSPVSSTSPWATNSNNFNAMPEKFRARRKSSFEGGIMLLSKPSHDTRLAITTCMFTVSAVQLRYISEPKYMHTMVTHYQDLKTTTTKNSTVHLGQAALKFFLSWATLS